MSKTYFPDLLIAVAKDTKQICDSHVWYIEEQLEHPLGYKVTIANEHGYEYKDIIPHSAIYTYLANLKS